MVGRSVISVFIILKIRKWCQVVSVMGHNAIPAAEPTASDRICNIPCDTGLHSHMCVHNVCKSLLFNVISDSDASTQLRPACAKSLHAPRLCCAHSSTSSGCSLQIQCLPAQTLSTAASSSFPGISSACCSRTFAKLIDDRLQLACSQVHELWSVALNSPHQALR